MRKRFAILMLLGLGMQVSADCLGVLFFCYDMGGSDMLCNTLYTICLEP